MNCYKYIFAFLKDKCNIVVPSDVKDAFDSNDVDYEKLDCDSKSIESLIICILIDTYNCNSNNIKIISDILMNEKILLGRNEKELIKHYLDYGDESSILTVCNSSNIKIEHIKETCSKFISKKSELEEEVIDKFCCNWKLADENNYKDKMIDYIQGIHSKLNFILNNQKRSLWNIFEENYGEIKKNLSNDSFILLQEFCNDKVNDDYKVINRKFYNYYISLLKKDLQSNSDNNELEDVMNKKSSLNTPFIDFKTEEFGFIFLKINQNMYNSCTNENQFYNLVLNLIKQTYRLLDNHKTLAVKIENIINYKNQNIKWHLYSVIGIFAEHFIPVVEKRKFYDPANITIDILKYKYCSITDEQTFAIKKYFKESHDLELLQSFFSFDIKHIVPELEKIWYGFTFSDCISVSTDNASINNEIKGLLSINDIVFIFNKYRHDDRKIPCPDCCSFKISGNSFPEVGLRSWECKNEKCPSRSKSNRGKRYSYKSNFMQFGYEDKKDIISKRIIEQWRRDIVEANDKELDEMLISYFSFSEDKILYINSEPLNSFNRTYSKIGLEQLTIGNILMKEDTYENYFNKGMYVSRFLLDEIDTKISKELELTSDITNTKEEILINGDSRKVLANINDNQFSAAVTSPPYYNAREYSQWPNLYLYLSDMYKIIKETYRVLKPGAIYLYNIGDICGNENTIVKSSMGNKRILLGAYTIYLFELAGFELIDNILWDKGEPQSNRQKNDGKFTPFYQKPMNVYEHMFLFKKPGEETIYDKSFMSKKNVWNTSIAKFFPVIKINNKKENKIGHTAPFPENIPDFVCKLFLPNSNDVLLEPFAGSGTSLIVAFKNNRKCVGVELSREYCSLIKKICEEEKVSLKEIYFEE